jgi:hypothetical protein
MKLNTKMKIFSAASLLLCASASYAQSVYHVDITTSPLIGNVSAPFSVDFQFIDGGTIGNNSATISHFTYGGGSPTGGATLIGGAVGGLDFNNVSFNNSSFLQELYQAFTPGTTLSFNVALTGNADVGSPDGFSVAILDNTQGNIPTTGFGSQLLQIDVTGAALTPQVFAGTGDFAGVTLSVAAIPEPQTYAMFMAGLALVGVAAARRKQK